MKILHLWIFGLVLLISCNLDEQDEQESDSHSYADLMTADTTIWTDQVELFVEYPVLIVGQKSSFAAHFTRLKDHEPIKSGRLSLSLIKGTEGIRHRIDAPSSPGIFTPALLPREAGIYRLIFELNTSEFKQKVEIGGVRVYKDEQEAQLALSSKQKKEAEISFLKEQAWKIQFQTTAVKSDSLRGVIAGSGSWQALPNEEWNINAASGGNVFFKASALLEGQEVKKDQLLMRISGEGLNSGNLAAEISQARANYEQAKADFERKKELLELEVLSRAEFEKAKKDYQISGSRYEKLIKNYSDQGIAILSPTDGFIKQIAVENGEFVSTGQNLLKVGTDHHHMLKVLVPINEREHLHKIDQVWVSLQDEMRPLEAEILSISKRVDAQQPRLAAYIRINEAVSVVEGELAEVHLAYPLPQKTLMIPTSSLLEDFGKYKVLVQSGGESFEMRQVSIGSIIGDRVAITSGLKEGEWIVSKGAYQVKMASMAGAAPAHGHAH